jgi:hypothetical protein
MRKRFLLYISDYAAIEDLSLEEKGLLLDAIFKYHIESSVIDLPPVLNMAFRFMKEHFDRDNQKYEIKCRTNRYNGAKGGRPPKNPINPDEPKKANGLFKNPNNPDEPKKADNDNDNDTKDSKRSTIPSFDEIKDYATYNQPGTDLHQLELKYKSWTVNHWRDGNDKPIKNWKSKLLNTLPHLLKEPRGLNKQTTKELMMP